MQVDVEMYLAASPPLFVSPLMGPLDVASVRPSMNHRRASSYRPRQLLHQSPLTNLEIGLSSMTLSSTLARAAAMPAASIATKRATVSCSPGANGKSVTPAAAAPLRSCLVIRSESVDEAEQKESTSSTDTDQKDRAKVSQTSPTSTSEESASSVHSLSRSTKKRVIFADDKGLSLTHVKMMTEPSDCPPRWTAEFLEQVTGGASAEVGADRWELTFAQPASDYMDFRSRLERQNVSLENVVIQDAEQQLVGTIKVKNLSYNKQVTVRVTFDSWQSHVDVDATFVPSGIHCSGSSPSSGSISLLDTFSFKIAIPSQVPSNRIQFCVRFACDAGEFWDNNIGRNYVVVKPVPEPVKNKLLLSSTVGNRKLPASRPITAAAAAAKYSDILTPGSKVDYWSDFASWNHLVNDSPYW